MADTSKVILFKKEAVYGTDPVPTVAASAALTRNFSAEPIVVDTLERNLDRQTRGRTKTANTNARGTFGYELELQGSGAAGTAPPWMEHLEACGMAAPVLTAATRAEQKFAGVGTALSSGCAHYYISNQRARALGSRGTFGMDFTAGAYAFAKLDMQGLLPAATPVDTLAPGVPVLTAWKDPLEVNTVNTDFALDGFAAVLQSFKFDINADVKPRNLVGANYIQRGNHSITGSIRCEAPDLASKNYFTSLLSGAQIAVQLIHGTVAGSIVQIDASFLQILKIARAEEDDVLMLDINFGLNLGVGQDDLLITAK